MKFLHPTFLFALFTLAIPIIIHLFSFRRFKTLYFSNVNFLKDIKKESKKESRLKQLLMLIARLLTLTMLVFAFSQPYIPSSREIKKQPRQLVAVYIDNSFSMNALSEKSQLLEAAKTKAIKIGMAYPPGTKFQLFTNDLNPKHQNLMNREQFVQQIAEIGTSPIVVPLSVIANRFSLRKVDADAKTDKTIYFISDFQRSITDIQYFDDKNTLTCFIPLVPNPSANLFIDSCWVEVPAHGLKQEEELFVKIRNSSDQDFQNLPLKLYINDSIKSITSFSISAQNEMVAKLTYTNNTSGWQNGKVETSDYPFTYDNEWFISYFVQPRLKTLAIYLDDASSTQGLSFLTAMFRDDDYIQMDIMNIKNLQVSELSGYNAIFLINLRNFSSGFLNELKQAANKGASLVFFPQNGENQDQSNMLLSAIGGTRITGKDTTTQKISGINFGNRFFDNVFSKREENALLPAIKGHFLFETGTRNMETRLLWFQNNNKALSVNNTGKGKIWTFAFPLDNSSEAFAKDILFVPVIYNIVLNSIPAQKLSYTIGKDTYFELGTSDISNANATLEIENSAIGERFIPGHRITGGTIGIETGNKITRSGLYKVYSNNRPVAATAFNYNRKESDLRYFSADKISTNAEKAGLKNIKIITDANSNFSEVVDDIQNGKQLWKWFIALALLFLLSEVLIARFWKPSPAAKK
ncbi:MAG: hypothetical protein CR996_01550 [Draconibacterium sp.]|nr:MAG: hypothetical protein CR996_01550 [Draconibacterium sp.]PIF06150.1 MAG: hypothetical protein CSA36_03075 [Draconibacterium sp.]